MQIPESDIVCSNCNFTILKGIDRCPNCTYPINGTEEEKQQFQSNQVEDQLLLKTAEGKIKRAINTLYIISILSSVVTIALIMMGLADTALILLMLLIGLAYAVLGYYAKNRPTRYLTIALVLLLSSCAFNFLLDPTQFFKGILFNIIFIIFLVQGIQAAYDGEKIKQKMSGLN